jgi:hypothetical protein
MDQEMDSGNSTQNPTQNKNYGYNKNQHYFYPNPPYPNYGYIPYGYHMHPNTTNINVQCNKCNELQMEIKNLSMQVTLLTKNIDLMNEQIKLLDMKIDISRQQSIKSKEKNNNTNIPFNNHRNNKNNNCHNSRKRRVQKHIIKEENEQDMEQNIEQENGLDNENSEENRYKQIRRSLFSESPFDQIPGKSKSGPFNSAVVIHIDEPSKSDLNANKKSKMVNPFALMGSIFSLIEGLEKNKNQAEENAKKESDEVDNVSEYNSDDEFDELDIEIKTIDDLIALGDKYEIENKVNSEKEKLTETSNEKNNSESSPEINKKPHIKSILKRGILMKDGTIKCINTDIPDIIKNKPEESKEKVISNKAKSYIINGKKYSINMETLSKLVTPLKKLKSMIGLDGVKNYIVDMILYYLQNFENKNNNMLHTVIEGPPGVGKTELGKILAEIYASMGVIPSNKFKLVKRSDLVGEYLGHTAPKTQKVIDEADGGVLFIDEAYSLGNEDKRDSFSKEAIDVINQNLSENKKKLIVIIAGYPDELEKCFFSYNPGLKRRFPFKFKIDGYNSDELKDIFIKKVNDAKWKINDDMTSNVLNEFFTKNKEEFPYYGGDIENLLLNCKFAHSRRVFGKHPKNKRKLNKTDLEIGFDRFVDNKKKHITGIPKYTHMYL